MATGHQVGRESSASHSKWQGQEFRKLPAQMIGDNPMSATLTAFGIGFGVGIFLGCALSESLRTPETQSAAERLGRQVMDAMGRVLPETLARHVRS